MQKVRCFFWNRYDQLETPRDTGDSGVDGIRVIGKNGRSLFSAHAPRQSKKTKDILDKLRDDAKEALAFINRHGKFLKEWYILLNRDLSGDEIEEINNICKEAGILKHKIFTLHVWKTIILENNIELIIGRALGLTQYRIPVNHLQPFAAAQEILNMLNELKYQSADARLYQLDMKQKEVLELAFPMESLEA